MAITLNNLLGVQQSVAIWWYVDIGMSVNPCINLYTSVEFALFGSVGLGLILFTVLCVRSIPVNFPSKNF